MGTNYYFFTKSKELAKNYFPSKLMPNQRRCDGAVLVDEPEFGYEIHIAKTSAGWVPLFESYVPTYKYFSEMEAFYMAHKDDLTIMDEYGEKFTWDEFKNTMIRHSQREPEPTKWYFDEGHNVLHGGTGKHLYCDRCRDGDEPDLWIPWRHDEYDRTQKEAARKFYCRAYGGYSGEADVPYRDDKYAFDWNYGSFF